MVCRREQGEYSEALRIYQSCREMLAQCFGVPPNERTMAVWQSVVERALPGARCLPGTVHVSGEPVRATMNA